MKHILGLLLCVIAFNAFAIDIKPSLSGSWFNPDQNGHGLSVEVLEDNKTLIYWYVYHPDGTPMFLITVGNNSGNRTSGETYYQTGMRFGDFNPNDVKQTIWGTTTVTFNDCGSASLRYSSNDPAYGSGTIPMQRLVSIAGNKCTDSVLHGTYNAVIHEQGDFGFGLAMLFENGDMVYFAGNELFGAVGGGVWRVTGSNTFAFDATSYSVFGGWNDVSGSGTFNEDALTATYTGNGELFATPIPSFQHGLSTAKMAGTYDIHDLNDTVIGTANVRSDGDITGSTVDGCKFDGALYVPNTEFNQAYIDAQVSNCGDIERILGAAVYNNPQELIVVAAFDGLTGYIWMLK